ncbi:MAG: ABC transporter ATP-binding protein [Lachnospiraceae bacterium]|nr:ABC transporter ATP-binding protein [Lachnospiraceae bacterium]
MIQVSHISRVYPNGKGVRDISFDVKPNTIMGLLGPNGAGKTTTMSVITGFVVPDEGCVTINGFDMIDNPIKAKKCIGYLPEIPPVYPDMYVEEYLDFVSSLKRVPKAERKEQIKEIMEKTDITSVSRRLIKNLSKGYRQRVGIAQALIGNPEVIILDEPTVGLDPEQIIEVRDLIRGLKEKHTVILSSHILSEIAAVCDECLIIASGKVVAIDSTENLLNRKHGGQLIKLTVKADSNQMDSLLSKCDFISEYKMASQKDAYITYEICGKEDKDIREPLSEAMFKEGILILEATVSKSSLEDIYLDLMKDVEAEEANQDDKIKAADADNSDGVSEDFNEETLVEESINSDEITESEAGNSGEKKEEK